MKRILPLLLAVAALSARGVVPADFAKTFTVTVPAGLVDAGETLASFPLLLRLGTGIAGFDYADFQQAGADILVTDAGANALPFELENWDTAGESRLWVRVPSVAAGTTLSVYYGTAETVAPPTGMWSGYAGVWHLNEAGDGATNIVDSTANGQDGTSHASSKARSDGVLGAARGLELGGKNGAMTTVPSSAVLDALVPTFTVSGWVRPKTLSLNWGYLFARKTSDADPCWGLQFRGKDGNSDSVGIYSNGNADNDNNRAVFATSSKFSANTWTKYAVVYDDTTIRLYLDGALVASKSAVPGAAVNKSNGFGIGGFPTSTNHSSLKADQDEVRLMNGAASAAWVAAEYRQESGAVALSYGAVGDMDATAPVVAAPVLSRDPATGVFTVAAEISGNVPASVVCDADGVTNTMATADTELPMTYAATLANLTANTTYACLVAATSTGGTVTKMACPTPFYNGDLAVAKVNDANEYGLVPGAFRISRADTAHDLVVAYTVGGTAIAGQTYAALSGTATIPAGSNSVDIAVAPLLDAQTTSDTTVSVALAAGLYGIDAQAGSAELTIANLVAPAGYNTWVASADGLASEGSNWSAGRAPTSSDNILFDGRFSTANCEWDTNATATVASWTQTNGYTGTVTVDTVFPGKGNFQCLTVTGPMAVMSGAITHPQSRTMTENHPATWDWLGDLLANETYRLRLAVGSLTVGADGLLDAKGKGYRVTNNSAMVNASHGGRASQAAQRCYGDPKEPIHIGLADKTQGNGGYYNGKGGGAIYVTSPGPVVVDGTIRADSDREGTGCCGAAGSVYLNASSVSGTGTISAYGPGSGDGNYKGTGGRVAIVTDDPVDRATFASITADSARLHSANRRATRFGGAGTVFFKDRTRPNGLLVVGSSTDALSPNWDQIYATASVTTDGDWTFDAVEFGRFGFLVVPAGTTLMLPNGLACCTGVVSSASAVGGIRYEGGTLDIGAGPQTIAGNWMFCAWSNYVFHADVTVKNGGLIGVHPINERVESGTTLPAFVSCDLAVDGDLTVESTGAIVATDCGFRKNRSDTHNGVLGFHSHGGRTLRWGRPDALFYEGYDSIFSPRLPGCSVPVPDGQTAGRCGGAVKLVVSGTLTLDGPANANGFPESHNGGGNASGGAGGSLDFTAGRLAGSGSITADGGSYAWQRGPGGRVAVKLTGAGAGFADFAGDIRASGRAVSPGGAEDASAGTVYLQTAADGDKGGTILIAMREGNRFAGNTNTTEMVSLGYGGDDVLDYKRVSYVVSDYGRAAANTNFTAKTVTIADTDSGIDLEGHELTVRDFFYVETEGETIRLRHLPPGTYGWSALEGYAWAADSSPEKTGRIVVHGAATVLIVK